MKAAGHWALPRRGRGARGLCLPPSHTSPWTESRTLPRRPGPPPNSHARPWVERARRAGPGRARGARRGGWEQPAVADSRPGAAGAPALRRSHRDSTRPGAARWAAGAGPALPPSRRPAPPLPGEAGRPGLPVAGQRAPPQGRRDPSQAAAGLGERPVFARGMPFHLHHPSEPHILSSQR